LTTTPPHNQDAEAAVLGGVLRAPDVLDELSERLDADAFWAVRHREIWRALVHIRASGKTPDRPLLIERLRELGDLDKCGGIHGIYQLADAVHTVANVRAYADVVQRNWIRRKVIALTQDLQAEANGEIDDMESWVSKAALRVGECLGDTPTALQTTADVAAEIRHDLTHPESVEAGIPSGLRDLDDVMGGFQRKALVLIGARPKMGKSALALQIAIQLARSAGPGAFWTLEMPAKQVLYRAVANEARVSSRSLRPGAEISGAEISRAARALRDLEQLPIMWDDSGSITIDALGARARRLKSQGLLEWLVVDYLQLMTATDKRMKREQQVAECSRGLKNLAMELDIPVIALSQLNRDVESRPGGKDMEGKRPRLGDLRESGSLEQDADAILFLFRAEYYDAKLDPSRAEIIVGKLRNGESKIVPVKWTGKFYRFDNWPWANERHRASNMDLPL